MARLDDFVDVAAAGGNVGVGELLDVLRDELFAPLLWVLVVMCVNVEHF